MTIHMTPTITDAKIAAMSLHDAFEYGRDLLDSRFPRESARVLTHVAEAEPDNGSVWELLGRAHFAAAHLRPAERAFRRLIELEPTNDWAHTALARSLERQGRRDEAASARRIARL